MSQKLSNILSFLSINLKVFLLASKALKGFVYVRQRSTQPKNLSLFLTLTFFSVLCMCDSAYSSDYKDYPSGRGLITNMEKFVSGNPDFSQNPDPNIAGKVKRLLCNKIMIEFLPTEEGKVIHRDIFQEIESDEQVKDIKVLKNNLDNTKNCIERFKLWLAYDAKWYKEKRDALYLKREALEKSWHAQVKDSGADIYDVVIEGVHFAIPRKYIWFGSRRPDGYIIDVNLQFFFPDMIAHDTRPSSHPDYKGMRTNIGGILQMDVIEIRPCPSVEGRDVCVNNYVTRSGRSSVYGTKCLVKYNYTRAHYYPWRVKKCEMDSTFDEDVGMLATKMSNEMQTFYEGHHLFPDYAFRCGKPPIAEEDYGMGICESYVMIREDIAFGYSFPRELFWKHREIHDAVRKKIESFVVREKNSSIRKGEK